LVPNIIQADHWYALNNYRDTIQLFNQSGIPADTIYYDSDNLTEWKSQSIERIDASKNGTSRGSWSVSESSTPGIPNSASSWRNTPSIFIDAGPVPFTPNNDGHDDFYKIICQIPSEQTMNISILSFDGKVVKTFTGPSQPEYLWDGRDSRGKFIPNGPFFVVIKIDGDKKNSVIRKKGVIWR
jgi:gliding motility-associated-like protein